MLILIISATLVFIGVPILLINSILKSEEKQLDLQLYNLGGSSAVEQRVRKKKPATRVKVEERSKSSVKPVNSPVKVNQSQKKQAIQKPIQKLKQTSQTVKRVPVTKGAPVNQPKPLPMEEPVDLAFHLKMTIVYDNTREILAKKVLSLRKKMPGYVYPSRQEMLLDQQAKENVPPPK